MERLGHFISLVGDVGLTGLVDIALVGLVIYAFVVALKRTRRSGLALTGIITMAVVYVAARKLNLQLTVALLQGFFAVFLLALVIIFQEDLRYFFERVGLWWIERRRPLRRRRVPRLRRREVEILARTLNDLARARVGALVVIRGRDFISRHIEGGVEVQGRVSESLIKSIFDPHSIGHDGAVVIEGNILDRLGCHLPLSKELEKLPRRGTRHAAALGLAERTDALCVVVSEERGDISVARNSEIRTVADAAELGEILEAFYDETDPDRRPIRWWDLVRHNSREKALSLALSVTLWMFFVHQSQTVERSYDVAVSYTLLPSQFKMESFDPAKVRVRFRGARRDFEFLRASDLRVEIPLVDGRQGKQLKEIMAHNLTHPSALIPVDIDPREVVFQVNMRTNPPSAL
jgi:diadenylate cyclase